MLVAHDHQWSGTPTGHDGRSDDQTRKLPWKGGFKHGREEETLLKREISANAVEAGEQIERQNAHNANCGGGSSLILTAIAIQPAADNVRKMACSRVQNVFVMLMAGTVRERATPSGIVRRSVLHHMNNCTTPSGAFKIRNALTARKNWRFDAPIILPGWECTRGLSQHPRNPSASAEGSRGGLTNGSIVVWSPHHSNRSCKQIIITN